MSMSLLAPAQWTQTEFALAQPGDQRLTQRLVHMGAGFAQNPDGTLPQVFQKMKDLKVALLLLQSGQGRKLTPDTIGREW